PPPALEQARRVATLPQLRDPQLDRPHTRVPFPGPIPVAVRDSIRVPFMPLRADLLGHLELHQGFCQDPHRLPKEVHICSGLAKQLLKCDHKVGGHDRNLLAVCFAYTHGTRLWPLLSRGRPHPGIYTTTWYSNEATVVARVNGRRLGRCRSTHIAFTAVRQPRRPSDSAPSPYRLSRSVSACKTASYAKW